MLTYMLNHFYVTKIMLLSSVTELGSSVDFTNQNTLYVPQRQLVLLY